VSISSPERRGFPIDCERVCDQCGHGEGLHTEGADVECVACAERGEGADCPTFDGVGAAWPSRRPEVASAGWR
jgi:hypothetical protein